MKQSKMERTKMEERLTEMEKDILKEISNMGAGNASTLLSKKIGEEIRLSTPVYKLISFDQVEKYVAVPKGVAICAFAKLKGEILGSTMLVFDTKSAFALADLLQKRKIGTTKWLSEKDQLKLKQVGHLVLRCYLNAISRFMNYELNSEKLRMFSTLGDAVIDLMLLGAKKSDHFIVLENNFVAEAKTHVAGRYVFILRTAQEYLLPMLVTSKTVAK